MKVCTRFGIPKITIGITELREIRFGIWDFPCSKLGIRDFKAKGGRRSGLKVCTSCRIPKKNIRITGLREIRFGIRDFKAKRGRDSGLKVCTGYRIPKITLEITGLRENLSRDDTGIDNLIEDPPARINNRNVDKLGVTKLITAIVF